MSSVPSPRVRKPNPLARLNHLTMTISNRADRACLRAGARWRKLRNRGRVRLADGQHPEHLKAAFAPLSLGDDARVLAKGGEAIAPEDGHVDEDVSLAAIRHNEAVALGGVEPFDPARDLDQPNRVLVAFRHTRRRFRRLYEFIAQFGPHSTRRLHILAAHEPSCASRLGPSARPPPKRRRSATQVIRPPR